MNKCVVFLCFFILCSQNHCESGGNMSKIGKSTNIINQLSEDGMIADYPGDILLAALIPMHRVNLTAKYEMQKCGELNIQDGIYVLEAMMFALDKINFEKSLRFTLGAIAMDTCQDADYALNQVIDVVQVLLTRFNNNDQLTCSDGGKPVPRDNLKVLRNVVGVIGASTSDVSIAAASFLKLFELPQISYFSTSPDLSNKSKYKYFMRTVPSDTLTVELIIKLLRKNNWLYIIVVHDTSHYGMQAANAFDQGLKEYADELRNNDKPICIANRVELKVHDPPYPYPYNQYYTSLLQIRSVKNAKVVVVFLSQPILQKFFLAISQHDFKGIRENYLWIGTDSWSGIDVSVEEKNSEMLSRSITVIPSADEIHGFQEYLMKLRPSKSQRNPWLKQYFESKCYCVYDERRRNATTKSCIDIEAECARTAFDDNQLILYVNYVVKAVHAYAHALEKMQNEICGKRIECKLTSGDIKGYKLLDHLRSIKFTDFTGKQFRFIDGVDGQAEFSILYYNRFSKMWEIGGAYTGANRLSLTPDFNAFCENFNASKCSSECPLNQVKKITPGQGGCCWSCDNCLDNQYVEVIKSDRGHTIYLCKPCLNGTRLMGNKTGCYNIPEESMTYGRPISYAIIITCLVGIILTVLISVLFIIARQTPIIRASGREASSMLLIGIFLSYILPIFMVAKPTGIICGITCVAPGVCCTICYAAVLAKTNRIARIFQMAKRTSKKLKYISPLSQIYIMSSMIAAESIILTILVAVANPKKKEVKDNYTNRILCDESGTLTVVTGLMFPILLLLLSTMYAFKIRKTPDGYNETRNLGFVNYINCFIFIISLPLIFSYKDTIDSSTPMCFLLIGSATAELVGLFLPKAYIVLIRPEKNTKDAVMRTRTQSQVSWINLAQAHRSSNENGANTNSAPARMGSESAPVFPTSEPAGSRLSGIAVPGLPGKPGHKKQKSVSFGEVNASAKIKTEISTQQQNGSIKTLF